MLEEMKLIVRELPLRLEQRMIEGPERFRPRKFALRRLHPMMIDQIAHMISPGRDDPITILLIASIFRDDFPWLYEIGLYAYHTAKSGNLKETHEALTAFRNAAKATAQGPFMEELGMDSKEIFMMLKELPLMIDHYRDRILPKAIRKSVRIDKVAKMIEEEGS